MLFTVHNKIQFKLAGCTAGKKAVRSEVIFQLEGAEQGEASFLHTIVFESVRRRQTHPGCRIFPKMC